MENNFNILKHTLSKIIFECNNTQNKELEKVWKSVLNEIKSSAILKTMYVVYNNIENHKFENKDTAEIFLNENLFSFGSFSKEAILNENKRIYNILKKYIPNSTQPKDEVFELILESTKDRKLSRLHHKAELFNSVSGRLVESKDGALEEITQSVNPMVINRAFELLNEKYSFLEENEKEILRAFVTKDEAKKQEIFESLVSDNIKFVKRNLFEQEGEDEELVSLLQESENELKKMTYSADTQITEFIKLINFSK